MSYERPSAEQQRVFRALAVFPASFAAPDAEVITNDAGHKHLSELVRLSLARFNPQKSRYDLHDLARFFADGRQDEAERAPTTRRYAKHYAALLEQANNLYLTGNDGVLRG